LLVEVVSGEWTLKRCKYANGGDMIVFRSLWASVCIYLVTIGVKEWCEPSSILEFNRGALREAVSKNLPWFGAIFVGVYATLHSRYASQWTYLANVYNRIKETDARGGIEDNRAMAEWKAGFLEDAEDLHLIGKPMFASLFRAWSKDGLVGEMFRTHTSNGPRRWAALLAKLGGGPEPTKAPALSADAAVNGGPE
jgi:hypothetical protein